MDIKTIIRTRTLKQSTITILGTTLNGGLGALFYFLLARFLGSQGYGAFSLAAASITLFADVLDLGSSQALVKFYSKYQSDPLSRLRVAKLALEIKFLSGLAILVLVWLISNPLADNFFRQPLLEAIFPLVGFGVLAQLLFSFSTSFAQATERFFFWGGLLVSTNLVRLVGILFIFFSRHLSSYTSTLVYSALPLVGFIFSWLFIDHRVLTVRGENTHLGEFFNFNIWVTAFLIVAAIASRLDTYLTARLIDLSAAGVYSLAVQIVAILPQLTVAVGTVTSVKLAHFTSNYQTHVYVQKACLLSTAIALVCSSLLLPLGYWVLRFSGSAFNAGLAPLVLLLLAMILFLAFSPIRDSIIYYFSRPQFFFWSGIAHFVLTIASIYILVPSYGIAGSALSVLLGQVFLALSSSWYYLKLYHSHVHSS